MTDHLHALALLQPLHHPPTQALIDILVSSDLAFPSIFHPICTICLLLGLLLASSGLGVSTARGEFNDATFMAASQYSLCLVINQLTGCP